MDRRQLVRSGIGLVLSGRDDVEMIGAFASAGELLARPWAVHLDDIVIVVGEVADDDEATEQILSFGRSPMAVVRLGNATTGDGRLDTAADVEYLIAHIRKISSMSPHSTRVRRTSSSDDHLTPRQLAVLEQICEGRSTVEISRALQVTPKTVEHHKQQMFARLGVHSRAEAVAAAFRLGVLPVAGASGGRR